MQVNDGPQMLYDNFLSNSIYLYSLLSQITNVPYNLYTNNNNSNSGHKDKTTANNGSLLMKMYQ